MEPPLPLISWVNPFPRRFINRTACFPWKVSYFREFVCHREKNKVGWKVELRSLSFDPLSFKNLYYTSIFTILQPLGPGYHEIKVNELPNWDWPWSDGRSAANWGSLKGYLFKCFFLPSYIPHVNMHFEKSRWLSFLWTICNFSMISTKKVPGSFDFGHHCGVDFTS